MVDFIFKLPIIQLNTILFNWIDTESLAKFDSCLCNKKYRNKFLKLLSDSSGIFVTFGYKSIANYSYLHWLIIRQLKVQYLLIYDFNSIQVFNNYSLITPISNLNELEVIKCDLIQTKLNYLFESLKILICSSYQTYDYSELSNLINNCPNLEQLTLGYTNLDHYHIFSSDGSSDKKCYNLTTFMCSFPNIKSDFLKRFTNSNRDLKIFVIVKTAITDSDIEILTCNCKHLQLIHLQECNNLTDLSILKISKHCHKLNVVRIVDCLYITQNCILSLLRSNPLLSTIDCTSCKLIDFTLIQSINTYNKYIHTVNFDGCSLLTDQCIITLINQSTLLISINLGKCILISDFAIIHIANNLGDNLLELSISECYELKNIGIIRISEKCLKLKHLDISYCNNISDDGITSIGKNIKSLEYLNVYQCFNISDDSLIVVIMNNKNIKYFNINYCDQITNGTVETLSKFNNKIEFFELSGFRYIENIIKEDIWNNWVNLKSISLERCDEVNDELIIIICKCVGHSLLKINLFGCLQVSNKSILEMSKYCKIIRELDISYNNTSDAAVSVLLHRCCNMRILKIIGCELNHNKLNNQFPYISIVTSDKQYFCKNFYLKNKI